MTCTFGYCRYNWNKKYGREGQFECRNCGRVGWHLKRANFPTTRVWEVALEIADQENEARKVLERTGYHP